ncbi:hypothetical protein [Bordetella sp. 2513F-2]
MDYESLYWAMAAVVAVALAGGALLARLQRLAASLAGVAVIAVLVLAAAFGLAHRGEFAPHAGLLAVAAGMFNLVIGAAATLVARKVRHRYFSP